MNLAAFLRENLDSVSGQWLEAAAAQFDDETTMLGDVVNPLLLAVAAEIDRSVSSRPDTSSIAARLQLPAVPLRFTPQRIASEFALLRETVLRQWRAQSASAEALDQVARFQLALDGLLIAALRESEEKREAAMTMSLAVLGHDLRNSLGGISMSANVLERFPGIPAPLKRTIGGLQTAVARMKLMINDLVDLVRVRSGTPIVLQRAGVDLAEICGKVVEEAQSTYPDFSYRFTTQGDLSGEWDGPRIAQALGDIAAHAAQFGSFRSPILVKAEGTAFEVLIQVGSQGLVPPAPLEQLFDPLLQLRPHETEAGAEVPAYRLGLFIAREIAEAHGGTLEAGTDPDVGATLTLRLPRV